MHFNVHVISWINSATKSAKFGIRRILMKQQYTNIKNILRINVEIFSKKNIPFSKQIKYFFFFYWIKVLFIMMFWCTDGVIIFVIAALLTPSSTNNFFHWKYNWEGILGKYVAVTCLPWHDLPCVYFLVKIILSWSPIHKSLCYSQSYHLLFS